MTNSTKLRELFRRVQHPQLQDTVKVIEVRAELDGITYSEAANHIISAVSKIPKYHLSPKVSIIQASGGNIGGNSGGGGPHKGGHNSGSIYNSQGKVHIGYYQNWKGLSKEDCKTIIAARKKKGNKSSRTARKKYIADTKRQLSEIPSTLTEMKTCISAFSGNPQGNNSSEANSGQEAPISWDAGNYFGRSASKHTKT